MCVRRRGEQKKKKRVIVLTVNSISVDIDSMEWLQFEMANRFHWTGNNRMRRQAHIECEELFKKYQTVASCVRFQLIVHDTGFLFYVHSLRIIRTLASCV